MGGLRCPVCGLVNFASNPTCRRCGGSIAAGQATPTGGLPYGGWQPTSHPPPYPGAGTGGFGVPHQWQDTFGPQTDQTQQEVAGSSGSVPPNVSGSADAAAGSDNPQSSGRSTPIPSGFSPPPVAFGQDQPWTPVGNPPPPYSGSPSMPLPPQDSFRPVAPPEAASYARTSYRPPGPYQRPYGYPARPANRRDGMALTSLILGCLAYFPITCAGYGVGSIVGIVLGVKAVANANRYPNEYGGKNLAIIGIVLNGFSLVVVVPILMAIMIPNLVKSRMAANEASAIATLDSIANAEATYQSTVGNGRSFGTLDQLIRSGFLAGNVATRHGYVFEVRLSENRGNWGSPQYGFEAFATPVAYDWTGRRSFYTNHDFIIREADKKGGQAGPSDSPVGSRRNVPQPAQ